MNVFFTFKELFLFVALMLSTICSFAQLEQYEVIAGEPFEYPIYSNPNSPSGSASHGSLVRSSAPGSGNYIYTYTSDPNFIGLDTLEFTYWDAPWAYSIKGVVLSVIPSKVTAENDYASTFVDVPILINVLANDFSSRNTASLQGIPLLNNCIASVEPPASILFVPEPGFEGIASLNYVVCDDIGTCATGSVSVSVQSNNTPEPYTVTNLATSKNTSLPIPLAFDDFEIESFPVKGSVAFIAPNVVEYEPNTDYVGLDQFILKKVYNGINIFRVFNIETLETQNQNGIIFDDYAFTPINTAIEIDVAANDLGNINVTYHSQSNHGSVEKISGKVLKFTPDTDFEGIATFTYKVGTLGNNETATVYVDVKNQNPADDIYPFTTPKNVPKALYYDVPIDDFVFNVEDQADHGNVQYFDGYIDTLILGYPISGKDIVVYTPNVDYVGLDEFEIRYCITTNGQCHLVKIEMEVLDMVTPSNDFCVAEDCVWPGDGNNDGVVNMIDLLQLGINIGLVGDSRSNASIDWYGQHANDWNKANPGSVADAKYVDMDGNGFVTDSDLSAMDVCYGLKHNLTPEYNPFAKQEPFYLELANSVPIATGDPNDEFDYLVTYDFILGKNYDPALDVYGFTFSFEYNPLIVEQNSVEVLFDDASWLTLNSPVLNLAKSPTHGRMDIGFTRTNGLSASGYGKIGVISFIVDDDILGVRASENIRLISLTDIIGMEADGSYYSLEDHTVELPFLGHPDDPLFENDLQIFPNPTKDVLNVYLSGSNIIEQMNIYTITGQHVMQVAKTNFAQAEISLADLTPGMYVIQAITEKGVISKKVQVAR